jgi:hypothetical protein
MRSDGGFQGALAELVFSSESFSEKDSDPTFHRHPATTTAGDRHKSTITQSINYSGRRTAIAEEREISKTTQIAWLQLVFYPRARECLFGQIAHSRRNKLVLVQ